VKPRFSETLILSLRYLDPPLRSPPIHYYRTHVSEPTWPNPYNRWFLSLRTDPSGSTHDTPRITVSPKSISGGIYAEGVPKQELVSYMNSTAHLNMNTDINSTGIVNLGETGNGDSKGVVGTSPRVSFLRGKSPIWRFELGAQKHESCTLNLEGSQEVDLGISGSE